MYFREKLKRWGKAVRRGIIYKGPWGHGKWTMEWNFEGRRFAAMYKMSVEWWWSGSFFWKR